ncbi:putative nucleotidyltransferase with HDIG domain [Desulfohalotomaculum tongense]|uniref:HD family phosphohydrolase n=1 Tax=Desulforadius tongensis TaxID=1216062 RepID=UPI00195949FA|nr:HDIG domain-containing metalloprotein [Desulforadius tongensis]MBM7855719.1 putative nucleotidyltransferase with HDIG domain [Desulforadius tongensis]
MIPLNKVGGTVMQSLTFLVKHRRVRRGSAAVFFMLVFTLLLSLDFFTSKVDLREGDVAPYDILAPRSVEYIDPVSTAELRRQAAEKVEKIYTVDDRVTLAVQSEITDLIEKIVSVQIDDTLDRENKIKALKEIIPFTLSEEVLNNLALAAPEDVRLVKDKVSKLIAGRMIAGIKKEELDTARDELIAKTAKLGFSPGFQQFATELVQNYLRPNRFYNAEETEAKRKLAAEKVEPVKIQIKAQQKVVEAGDVVTRQDILELQALGLLHAKQPWTSLVGRALLVAALMAAVLFYLRQQNREIYHNVGQLYLLGIVVFIVVTVSKVLVAIEIARWPELGALLGYMAPVAAAGMLIAILLEYRLAVLMVAVISLFIGVMTDNQLNFSLVGFLGGMTGVYSVSKLSQRGDLARAGLYTGIAVMLSIIVVGMVEETPWRLLLVSAGVLGLSNGLLSSVLTNGALPYLESTFGITSSVKLLELSNPCHPLLRKLLTEAPGTYHHSIIVGNLAEAATEAVGGDHLLVRVGALYHDIGKVKRPYFFIENQLAGENPHEKIAPNLSTLILTSHVKDGVDLAREYKLPRRVIDIIEQHHGTSLVRFFYNKALEGDRAETVKEEDFRYDGPKPQTKEAAIVMLADSVEAAVRSMKNPTSGQVEGLVRKLIKQKLMDGQLDECDLTLKDLDTITNSFLQVLSGVFHSRIEYPDMQQEMERRKTRGAGCRK